MAAGGQGAPLAPGFHQAFFGHDKTSRVVVNIGGIANLSILSDDDRQPVTGFDTGPGNGLMGSWAQRHLGQPLDTDGQWAARGQVDRSLLTELLADRYFSAAPPKSTGREYFNLHWLDSHLQQRQTTAVDVQATLLALTCETIADAIERFAPQTRQVLICGGGVHNGALMQSLEHRFTVPVRSTADFGVDPDYLEATGFAWLARQTLNGLPGNLPAVTGAKGLRVLGGIYPA